MKITIGPLFTLFLVLLVLKLTGHIDWSWWWVTAPVWGWIALAIGFVALVATGLITADGVKKLREMLK